MFQKQMESVAMVMMAEMTEFVKKHIVLKNAWETNDIEVEIDVPFG